jgi:hypothetical protein
MSVKLNILHSSPKVIYFNPLLSLKYREKLIIFEQLNKQMVNYYIFRTKHIIKINKWRRRQKYDPHS